MPIVSNYPASKMSSVVARGKRLNAKLRDTYYRWRYRENRWERRTISIQDQVGGQLEWEEVGLLGLTFLKARGLEPQSSLLDAGCGSFRIGRHLINYLDQARYSGFDGSHYLLDRGKSEILSNECNIQTKQPLIKHVFITDEIVDLHSIFARRYDFIWVHAIFDHIPPERITTFLQSLMTVTHRGSRIYATFFLNPFGDEYREPIKRLRYGKEEKSIFTFPDSEYWHHTPEFYRAICNAVVGLRYSRYHDYNYPLEGLKVAELEVTTQ